MASVRSVPFTVTTSGTTQDITSSGFGTPVAALFVLTAATADGASGSGRDDARLSVGATDGSRSFVCSGYSEHGLTVSDNKSYADTTNVIDVRDMSAGTEMQGAFSAWVTDGVRVNWGTTPGTAYKGMCILFGGDNMVAEVGTHDTTGTLVGNEAAKTYTDMTVAPECVICVSAYINAMTGSESSDWDLGFGWGTSSTANVSRGWSLEAVAGVNRTAGYIASDRILCWGDYTGGTRETLELTRLDTSGGKGRHGLTVRDSADDVLYGFLAFSTGGTASIECDLYQFDFTTATTSDYSGTAFKPAFSLLGLSNIHYSNIDTNQTNTLVPTMGLAAFDDLDSEGDSYSAQVQKNWVTATDTQSYYESTTIALPNQTGGALAYAGDTPSFTSDGFDFTVTDTVANTKGLIVLAIQEVTLVPTGIASGAGIGSPTLDLTIYPDGFNDAARCGTPSLNLTVYPDGFNEAARCGSPVVAGPVTVTGIASGAGVGSPHVDFVVGPTGIASGSAVGSPTLDLTVYPDGLASTSAVGTPTVDSNPPTQAVLPTGIASGSGIGTPQVDLTIYPTGVGATSAVGSPGVSISSGTQTITVSGIATTVAVPGPRLFRAGDAYTTAWQLTGASVEGQLSADTVVGQLTAAKVRGQLSFDA